MSRKLADPKDRRTLTNDKFETKKKNFLQRLQREQPTGLTGKSSH